MIVDTVPLRTGPSRLGDFGIIGCPEGDHLIAVVDDLRGKMFDADLADAAEAVEASRELNNKPSWFITGCDAYAAKLRSLVGRMQTKLGGGQPPLGISTGGGQPPSEGLSTVAKVGLGLGALALGGVAIALIVRK